MKRYDTAVSSSSHTLPLVPGRRRRRLASPTRIDWRCYSSSTNTPGELAKKVQDRRHLERVYGVRRDCRVHRVKPSLPRMLLYGQDCIHVASVRLLLLANAKQGSAATRADSLNFRAHTEDTTPLKHTVFGERTEIAVRLSWC